MNSEKTNKIAGFIQSEYSLELPSKVVALISKLIEKGTDDSIITDTIKKCITESTHRWKQSDDGRGNIFQFPLYYQKTHMYSAHDFSIWSDKGEGYQAYELISSIERKLLGMDKDLEALKQRVEKYALLREIESSLSGIIQMVDELESRIDDHNAGKIESIPIDDVFKELE